MGLKRTEAPQGLNLAASKRSHLRTGMLILLLVEHEEIVKSARFYNRRRAQGARERATGSPGILNLTIMATKLHIMLMAENA